jgi:hypothetical protein
MFKILQIFVGDNGILRQIKWLNKNEDIEPEEEIYNWQWLSFTRDIVSLRNIDKSKSTETSIYMDHAHIQYDNLRCTFTYYSEIYILNRLK